jgi:hypothetical protein
MRPYLCGEITQLPELHDFARIPAPEIFASAVRFFMQRHFFHLPLFTLLLSLLVAPTFAQQTSEAQSSSQVAVSDKAGQEAVCDGALEIIPSGTVTFARKRYVPPLPKPKSKSKLAKSRSKTRR